WVGGWGIRGRKGKPAPTQGPSSISSLEPAASTLGFVGSIATVGSFCLFCGKGAVGPLVTRASTAAWATAGAAPIPSTIRAMRKRPCFSIRTSCPDDGSPASHPTAGGLMSNQRGRLRQVLQGLGQLLVRQLQVDELAGEVRLVCRHVEVPVAGEVEEDHPLLFGLLGGLGLVEDGPDRVGGLGPGDDPLAPREADGGLERGGLLDR